MGLDAVERRGLGFGDHLMGHRQFLDAVDSVIQRVMRGLGRPHPQMCRMT
jgi:hypothetical protein